MAHINIGFFSETLGMCATCDVILPQRVAPTEQDEKLPVLWLLHGATGNHADWSRYTSIERYARQLGLCVIMPSAQNSAYVDMAHGMRFYSYITDELPRKMRGFFPLSDQREDNFVCGLSMGGEGAFRIGLSKPENYAAIGCLSAGALNHTGSLMNGPNYALIHGDCPLENTYRDPLFQARTLVAQGGPFPRIYHACGDADFLLSCAHEARDYFSALTNNPFDYLYEEDPGAHTWEFWDAHIQKFLAYLKLPKPQPGVFF